ncbi:MAG: sulfotransferase family protein [Planctomycetota bacterium]
MPWAPRLWHGMTASAWMKLLRDNRFAIAPSRIPLALGVSTASLVNSSLAAAQSMFWKRRIEATELREDPIFVVGHWRSGTTLLHELLSADPRHAYPDTYACLAPSHFLISQYLVPWWLGLLMPRHRPMDNVQIGWKQPQEDEWALCLLGLPSVYRTVAFPQRLPHCSHSLALHGSLPEETSRWNQTFVDFLKSLLVGRDELRLVLKSPTHTARIGHLWNLFPKARFVHVVRDPLSIFPSTMRLWTRLAADHGLQLPDERKLERYVLDTFVQMYEAFETQRRQIPPGQIRDVHYEQLIADPAGQVRGLYEQLDLGDFDIARPCIDQKLKASSGYRANRYEVTDELRQRIEDRWGDYYRRYGYSTGARTEASHPSIQRRAG